MEEAMHHSETVHPCIGHQNDITGRNPGRIVNGAKADVAIDMWEHHSAKLSTEYGEEVSAKMKVAVLFAMLPKDLQEKVLDKCAMNWEWAKQEDAVTIYNKVK